MNKKNTNAAWYIIIVLLLSALTAWAAARWTVGDPGVTFRAAALISLIFWSLLALLWKRAGKGWTLAVLLLLSFGLRFGFGLASVNLLPEYGHPNERREEMGFLFDDAYRRDEEAWTASVKEDLSFTDTLTREYHNDQYGGLALLSVWLYEYISPDARRFTLIILIGCFFSALGLPFFFKGTLERFGKRSALIAACVYALYPDSIFYSGAPMREPFLIGILGAAFFMLCRLRENKAKYGLLLTLCIIACLPFSTLVAAALIGVSLLWIWAEFLIPRSKAWLWIGVILAVLGILASVIVALPAFKEWIHYDVHTTERSSGWVEKVVGEIGGQFRALFLAVYGLTQPVLPAILVYPTAPACDLAHGPCTTIFWKVVGVFRAAGWYMLVPFLLYAIFSTLRVKDKKERALLIVNALFILVWMFISSLRAGGDQWDNPRYRVIFLPWLAFMAAWGIDFALKNRDLWLTRWIAIEVIFLVFFTQWYYSRYSADAISRFPFWKTVTYIVICSAAVFATGLIVPLRKKLKKGRE